MEATLLLCMSTCMSMGSLTRPARTMKQLTVCASRTESARRVIRATRRPASCLGRASQLSTTPSTHCRSTDSLAQVSSISKKAGGSFKRTCQPRFWLSSHTYAIDLQHRDSLFGTDAGQQNAAVPMRQFMIFLALSESICKAEMVHGPVSGVFLVCCFQVKETILTLLRTYSLDSQLCAKVGRGLDTNPTAQTCLLNIKWLQKLLAVVLMRTGKWDSKLFKNLEEAVFFTLSVSLSFFSSLLQYLVGAETFGWERVCADGFCRLPEDQP
jgi:hypothetical protein